MTDVVLALTLFSGLLLWNRSYKCLRPKERRAWDVRTKTLSSMSEIPSVPFVVRTLTGDGMSKQNACCVAVRQL